MGALGLRDPRDVPAAFLVRWITHNRAQLDAMGGPSIFGGGAGPINVKRAPLCPAGAGKFDSFTQDLSDCVIEDVGNTAVPLFRGSAPPPPFGLLYTGLDNICAVDFDTLERVGGMDYGCITPFGRGCRAAPWLGGIHGIALHAFTSPGAAVRLAEWIDDQVDRHLPPRAIKARIIGPDLFPRFSDLFEIGHAYVLPSCVGGKPRLWATVHARSWAPPVCLDDAKQ